MKRRVKFSTLILTNPSLISIHIMTIMINETQVFILVFGFLFFFFLVLI